MVAELDELYSRLGYRNFKIEPDSIRVYYKFIQEGFQVCLIVDERNGFVLTPEQHKALEEKVMNLFYHPVGILEGFPEGIPIYQVECLTIVVGNRMERIKGLCGECSNCWGIHEATRTLLIYENQSGDCFGLKREIENLLENGRRGKRIGVSRFLPQKLPYVTIAITSINVIVFLCMFFLSRGEIDSVYVITYGGNFPPYVIERGEWWRILTSMFIHFDVEHLLNNMVMFCCVGAIIEKAIGAVKYAGIYLMSGLAGGLFSLFMMVHEQEFAVAAGASGAVFGMIGALLAVVLRHKGRYSGLTGRGVIFMIVLSLYYGFSTVGVDNWAHIGGMVTGFIMTLIFYRINRQKD